MDNFEEPKYGIDGKPIRNSILGFEKSKETLPFKFMLILIIILFGVNFYLKSGMISYLMQSLIWILIISYYVYHKKNKNNQSSQISKYDSSYDEDLIDEYK
ncbi:MAG: hypothetical protein PF569_07585 [Candidatus Woesearchaeota archaeon]|jgi:hypothetical protein|nr:hypothetical protein [Candidatus Woesearchaeota archaeon]